MKMLGIYTRFAEILGPGLYLHHTLLFTLLLNYKQQTKKNKINSPTQNFFQFCRFLNKFLCSFSVLRHIEKQQKIFS